MEKEAWCVTYMGQDPPPPPPNKGGTSERLVRDLCETCVRKTYLSSATLSSLMLRLGCAESAASAAPPDPPPPPPPVASLMRAAASARASSAALRYWLATALICLGGSSRSWRGRGGGVGGWYRGRGMHEGR